MTDALFPATVSLDRLEVFPAHGLSAPAAGVVYSGGPSRGGVPLGGLGTGYVAVDLDG